MAFSTDANRILRALKEADLGVGQWLDNRFIQTPAVQELADAGYITIDQNKSRLALTELGYRVLFSQSEAAIEDYLRKDKAHEIKAVCVLHNETSTGCLSPIAAIRHAIDAAGHPALFMVDTVSSLASTDYRHDEWGVDVTVGGAQKGLMLPPGMSFNAISDKAIAASKRSQCRKSFWSWDDMLDTNKIGFFPYTPATNTLQGLVVAIDMLHEEGLENVFARHDRLAEATRHAVRAWGLEIMCRDPKFYSPTVTGVMVPQGHDADAFRNLALDYFNISYGTSFGRFAGKMFRIGHLGDTNDAMILGALAATEMGLALAGVPHRKGGVQAAMDYLVSVHGSLHAKQA
jgi:alanine-glyoxylate transaminase / serine-glyoxylate transaminase / serine-pyruvate transaminase